MNQSNPETVAVVVGGFVLFISCGQQRAQSLANLPRGGRFGNQSVGRDTFGSRNVCPSLKCRGTGGLAPPFGSLLVSFALLVCVHSFP